MTIEKFMEILAEEKGIEWSKAYGGQIRGKVPGTKLDDFCPITWVAFRQGRGYFHLSSYHQAARCLGLGRESADRIAESADYSNLYPGDFTNQLFAVCGLEEEER